MIYWKESSDAIYQVKISRKSFYDHIGKHWEEWIEKKQIEKLYDAGLLVREEDRLVATKQGIMVLDTILKHLILGIKEP